jgi:nitroimidazol reductase NimA-like FMN-containing flavoprotein (pyridoxamine 5'-phosphate oxidase superfamily)
MTAFARTRLNRVTRRHKRGLYDRETIHRILDEALICHVGFVENEQPYVIPMNFARAGDAIVLHGSKASRLLNHLGAGHPACVEVTLVDGLVLARSLFNHSFNYRSVVLFGSGRTVEEDQEKLAALEAISEHIMPGRWREARLPNREEMDATTVVSIAIDQASAKVRTGPPVDDAADIALPIWAGVLPLQETFLAPIRDEFGAEDIAVPGYIAGYTRKHK